MVSTPKLFTSTIHNGPQKPQEPKSQCEPLPLPKNYVPKPLPSIILPAN